MCEHEYEERVNDDERAVWRRRRRVRWEIRVDLAEGVGREATKARRRSLGVDEE